MKIKLNFILIQAVGLGALAFQADAAVINGVTVIDSATAFSPDYAASKAVDGDAGDYASQNAGPDTFLTFQFSSAQSVDRIVVINRDSPADSDLITSFTLTFDGSSPVSLTRPALRGASTILTLGSTFQATTVRLDVDATATGGAGGNTGVMEVFFLSPMAGKAQIPAVSILGAATAFNAEYAATGAVDGIVGRSNGAGVKPEYASQSLGLSTFVDFDLGAVRPVSGFDFYDRPAGADRVTGFDMIFSQNDVFGDGDDILRSFTNSGMAMSAEFADIDARYVRYDVTASSGGGLNNGISEMVFYETVPEPSVSVFAAGTLAGLTLSRRRR